jgi:hypothetical protein
MVCKASRLATPLPAHKPHGLAQSHAVKRVANRTGIGEVRLLAPSRNVIDHCVARGWAQAILALRGQHFGDGKEFAGIVVGKIDVVCDARPKTGV